MNLTCNNYTRSGFGKVEVGHVNRTGLADIAQAHSLNSSHQSRDCSQPGLMPPEATACCRQLFQLVDGPEELVAQLSATLQRQLLLPLLRLNVGAAHPTIRTCYVLRCSIHRRERCREALKGVAPLPSGPEIFPGRRLPQDDVRPPREGVRELDAFPGCPHHRGRDALQPPSGRSIPERTPEN